MGIIYNMQRYSLHDGPGIRTVVFLKGCPLRCRWCCNPESQNPLPEPMLKNGRQETVGYEASAEEILRAVRQDEIFYRKGGGMTLSGGEPLLQGDFMLELLREAARYHIPAALETCGHGDYDLLRAACGLLGYLLYDVKSLNSAKHKAYTGVGNERILLNLARLCEEFPRLPKRVRMPVIPGFNEEEAQEIMAHAKQYPNTSFEPLPYHAFGVPKYAALGRNYSL
ncbi:MAG: radical SAM protein [Oscillospiraceae bacterium]|jgi:pyruvate formate lyase activating enzyme|nr:radical SAM protein [Oscillospiraceae bacterium]